MHEDPGCLIMSLRSLVSKCLNEKNFQHVDDINETINKIMEKITTETKKRRKKKDKKKMSKPEQAMRFVQHVTEQASQFNPLARRSEEHQKLL